MAYLCTLFLWLPCGTPFSPSFLAGARGPRHCRAVTWVGYLGTGEYSKSLNFQLKILKIPCCHNTLIMQACFAVWWVTGEVSGGWGGGEGRDSNQLQSEYLPPGQHLFHFRAPSTSIQIFFKKEIFSPFYARPHVNGVFGHHEKHVFENGP